MYQWEAKKLKAGSEVLWLGRDGRFARGLVIAKRYNTVWILWSDIGQHTHYVDTMDKVFTQEQLDQIATEKRVVERIKEINKNKVFPVF